MKRHSLWINLTMVVTILILVASPTTGGNAASLTSPTLTSTTASALASTPTRIRFAVGGTSATVSGDLAAKSSVRYVLRALANQLMDVTLTAPAGPSLTVTTAAGYVLTPVTGSSTSFSGYLPRTGDYILEVKSGSQPVSYSLAVSIPERVSFARGATSATLKGKLIAHQSHDYILRAMAGQVIEINLPPESGLQFAVFGVDGAVLRSGIAEGSTFRGELPLSQDYIVTLNAGETDVSYTFDVAIPARISFARGAISAALSSWVKANGSQYYVLRALKDQTMTVKVTSARAVQLVIYGVDGAVLKSGMSEGASFSGVLTATQDYIVVVKAGAAASSFTLKVTIQ